MKTEVSTWRLFSVALLGASAAAGVLFSGCQTGVLTTPSKVQAAEVSAAETFAVEPLVGVSRAIPLTPSSLEHATRQAIIQGMEQKGYRLAGGDEVADLSITPRWVVTQVENPMWRTPTTDIDRGTRYPSTVPAANLRLAVAMDGQTVWRGDSGWPLLLGTFSVARLDQSVYLALGTLAERDNQEVSESGN